MKQLQDISKTFITMSGMWSWKTTEHQILLHIQVFWNMTFSHQVNIFPRIVFPCPRVPSVAMLDLMKRHTSPWKEQKLLAQWHSVASHKSENFIQTAMPTSNLASHLALTSCYQYYVPINIIIQSISKWYSRQCLISFQIILKNLENLKTFKKQLKAFLLQQIFYSVDEYLSYTQEKNPLPT
jgi:hypothetical protein